MDAAITVRALNALIREQEAVADPDYNYISMLEQHRDEAEDRRLREHYQHVHQARWDRDEYDLY